jgi:hypothetical protein
MQPIVFNAPVYASTGDFSSDFVAASPYSYNHSVSDGSYDPINGTYDFTKVGGGAYDDRTIGKNADVVESLESSDFVSYDTVTYLHQITVADAPTKSNDSPQTIEIDYSFLRDSTGSSGAGFEKIMGVYVNRGTIQDLIPGEDNSDSGNIENGTSTSPVPYSTSTTGALFQPKALLKCTATLDGLEYGETVVVRIDVLIRFNPGSNPTGNLQASVDAMRLVKINGETPVTKKNSISTGAQTVPFKIGDIVSPVINIDKTTEGWKGTTTVFADDVNIPMGNDVTWKYVVTNPGTVPLSNVTVVDNNGTPLDTSDDFTVPITSLQAGSDANNNSILDMTETWTYLYTKSDSAVKGDYDNIATAKGYYSALAATDTDSSSYFGVDSKINIDKTTYGWKDLQQVYDDDVNINSGSDVTWKYVVTNTGNVALSNITVTDDNGTPDDNDPNTTADTADDFTLPASSLQAGSDANNNGILDLTETWTYLYTSPTKAAVDDYDNIGTVTGTYLNHFQATDNDSSSYFGVDSDISIAKTTRDAIDGTYKDDAKLVSGQTVMWQYVVTNTGNYPMSEVTITDDNGTPDDNDPNTTADTADDFTLPASSLQAGSDANNNGILDLTETWTYLYTSPNPALSGEDGNPGTYANTSTATATGLGQGLAEASDNSNYTAYTIGIEVTKVFSAGPYANTEYTTYSIVNTSVSGTPDEFHVHAIVTDPKLSINYTLPNPLTAGQSADVTVGSQVNGSTVNPLVDAWITIFDDEVAAEDIHFYGEP